jgi:hypothetical protein
MTLIAPAFSIASRKVKKNVSRSTRSEMFAGAQFIPDSGCP